MDKIMNIEYNSEYVEIESSNKYIYKIPNNNSYIRTLLYKGISFNKEINEDIKFCDKCADICIYPTWIALGFLAYGVATNFLALDLLMILCGGMAGMSLVGTTVFKLVSKNLKNKANNNEYFSKIYEYAINGGKVNNKNKTNIKQNVKSTGSTKKSVAIQHDKKVELNNNSYNLTKSEVIQNEDARQRKR